MAEYVVEITEILHKEIIVKADSYEQAKRMVKDMYSNEEVVLNEMDYVGIEVNVKEILVKQDNKYI